MALLSLRGAAKGFGARTILDGLDFDIEAGARVGMIGPNGGGKSTLLRLLAGEEALDAGELTQRRGLVVAYLPQQVEGDGRDALETVQAARPDLAELEQELGQVATQLGTLGDDLDRMTRVLRRQEELVERWTAAGGPGFEGRARALLLELGLEDDDLGKPTRILSGGQRKLVSLAACLAREPDVLLLDEPEAHLDVAARERLEELMRGFDGAFVAVSHDRYLLDETVTEIAELNGGRDPHVARQLLRVHGCARARAAPARAGVRDAAEGDRAARGGRSAASRTGRAACPTSATSSRRGTSSARSTAWRRSTGPCSSGARSASSCARICAAASGSSSWRTSRS